MTRKDYGFIGVEAARSVMLELVRLLAEYRDDIVVVGGWVPALLIPQDRQRHIGSTDVDLALNHRTLTGTGYKTICRLLGGRGYTQDKKTPMSVFCICSGHLVSSERPERRCLVRRRDRD